MCTFNSLVTKFVWVRVILKNTNLDFSVCTILDYETFVFIFLLGTYIPHSFRLFERHL